VVDDLAAVPDARLLGERRRELGLLGSRAADDLAPLPEELAAHLTGHRPGEVRDIAARAGLGAGRAVGLAPLGTGVAESEERRDGEQRSDDR
jgi:hypothetical protein